MKLPPLLSILACVIVALAACDSRGGNEPVRAEAEASRRARPFLYHTRPGRPAADRIAWSLPSLFPCPPAEWVRDRLEASNEADRTDRTVRVDLRTRNVAEVGEALTFTTLLSAAGLPIVGGEVEAVVRTPGGLCTSFELLDDGDGPDRVASDGVYSATYEVPHVTGTYLLFLTAEGTTEQGVPVVRAHARTFVAAAPARRPPEMHPQVLTEIPRLGLTLDSLRPGVTPGF
jgi:hypothetical protein